MPRLLNPGAALPGLNDETHVLDRALDVGKTSALQREPHAAWRLTRLASSRETDNSAGQVKHQPVQQNEAAVQRGFRVTNTLLELGQGEARVMKRQAHSSAISQYAMDFLQRLGNVHVRQGNV